ncbi:MAG: hypothetical protein GX446_06135 [Chthonomonadales bacterium]|nr:hypothetical protein [Chthonomonadales bacterium]
MKDPDHTTRPTVRWAIWAAGILVIGASLAVYAARTRLVAIPLCVAEAVPEQARLVGDTWVWLERTNGATKVVSVRSGRRVVLAAHEDVVSLEASPESVAWIGKAGDAWEIRTARIDGSNASTAASMKERPLAVWTDGSRLAWVVEIPSPATAANFLPPLGPQTQIWLAAGGAAHPIAEVAEGFVSAQLRGMLNGTLYLAGVRNEGIRSTVLYAVSPAMPPRRFAAEIGARSTLMTADGRIYWTAPSRGSNSLLTGCVRSAEPGKLEPTTVADWLPAGGRLAETARGVVVTGAGTETAWLVSPQKRLGVPLPMLPDQWPVAAGGHVLLTVHRAKTPGRVVVSTVGMR